MAGWKIINIGELGRVITGKTPSTKRPEYYGGIYPFITPTDIGGNNHLVQTARFLSEEGCKSFQSILLPVGSVCFVCIGATIGKICITDKPSFTNQQINSIIVDQKHYDNRFVYHLLRTRADNIKRIAGGAATPIVNKTAFSSVEVRVPPLPIQRKIAAILSAYDDLIENNLRRIKILEEMAQLIYCEWFVKFRFPGHEKVKMVDSPLGKIPEGWEVVRFTDIADVLSGGTPKTNCCDYWNGKIPFFTPKDVPQSFYVLETDKSITELGLSKCNSQLYPKDTVFITARGTVGNIAMPSVDMAMNQSCYALRAREGISQEYLFLNTLNQKEYLKKNTGGATFDTIIVDTFRRTNVLKPPSYLINNFSKNIRPFLDQVLNLSVKNVNLRRTRDLLLPKLISGELDISELDIQVPENSEQTS